MAASRLPFRAFATDFDGTLAEEGVVPPEALDALKRLRSAEVRLIMVTGRELEDLSEVFPQMDLFDIIVAENGALLHWPGKRFSQRLAEPPPARFIAELEARGVSPISVGQSIVATKEPHQQIVLDCIQHLGLELHLIFNKGAVMILPSGVNKATGLQAALDELKLKAAEVVGIGDAENDHAFLEMCGFPVAVQDALPALKKRASLVTRAGAGYAIAELAELILSGQLPH